MLIKIPPKHSVASVVGYMKGKSAIAVARQFGGKQRNFNGESLWARGYAVSTVGFNEVEIRAYIKHQEQLGVYEGSLEEEVVLIIGAFEALKLVRPPQPLGAAPNLSSVPAFAGTS